MKNTMGRAAATAVAALLGLAGGALGGQTSDEGVFATLVAEERARLVAQQVQHVLIFRWKWATLWDYGVNEVVEEGFNSAEACAEQAQAQEKERGRGLEVIVGTNGVLPRFFCRQATKLDLDALARSGVFRERGVRVGDTVWH